MPLAALIAESLNTDGTVVVPPDEPPPEQATGGGGGRFLVAQRVEADARRRYAARIARLQTTARASLLVGFRASIKPAAAGSRARLAVAAEEEAGPAVVRAAHRTDFAIRSAVADDTEIIALAGAWFFGGGDQ